MLDWDTPEKRRELETSDNPFALIILATLEGRKRQDDQSRYEFRERLIELFAARNDPADPEYSKRLENLDYFWEVVLGTSKELEQQIALKLADMYRGGSSMAQSGGYQMTFETQAGQIFLQEMKERLRPEIKEELRPELEEELRPKFEQAAEKAAKEAAKEAAEEVLDKTLKSFHDLYAAGKLSRLDAEGILKDYLPFEQVTPTLLAWDQEMKAQKK